MAPLAFLMGGICGTFSAMVSWLLLGVGFWGAVQVYAVVGFAVAVALILLAMAGPRQPGKAAARTAVQQA